MNVIITDSRTVKSVMPILVAGLLAGCAAITGYDPTSYKTATDLKAKEKDDDTTK